jgi:hypothetical protein
MVPNLSWRAACRTLALVILAVAPGSAMAATIWDGPMLAFSKAADADPTDPANQDRITDAVWITRDSLNGLFNIAVENAFGTGSPTDTEWAWDLDGINSGLNISAANYANLTFNSWADAFGGQGTGGGGGTTGPPATVGIPGVLHLISDDIYIDIMITSWAGPGGGGAFSYMRSTVPEPGTGVLLGLGLWLLTGRRRD